MPQYINEHDEQIRNNAIDNFASYMTSYIYENGVEDLANSPYATMQNIAEQMKNN